MITVPFSIHELCDSGEERLLSCNDVCEKVASFKEVFRGIDAKLVALHMPRSSELVCAVAALVDIHTPFLILQPGDNPVSLRAHFLFDGKELVEINSLHECTSDEAEEQDFCYFISTSGTTGSAKLVGVPYSCIGPNIEDFSERFSITSDDLVLCSTSFCFDPSIVELFLTFTSGAQLLLVPDRIRSQPHLFSNVLKTYTPTFVQLTPSVLSLFDESTLSWIFSDHSLIRCLLIGGTRRCRVNGVWGGEFTATGDIVDVVDGKYVVVGRTDDQIKLNGIRCNLAALSEIVHTLRGVFFAYFLLYRDKFLVLFVKSETAIEGSLQQIMSSSFIPSKVIYLDRVPLTPSGKVDRLKLTLMLEEQCSAQMKSWSDIFKFLEKFGIRHTPDLSFQSFVNYGSKRIGCSDVVIDVSVILSLQPDISWACDTKKCIDGTPLLTKLFDEDVVAACSHSGVVVCLRLRDGFCLWKTRIHCRFETSPTRTGDYIVVGGYDGGVYFLSANTGVTEWRFGCGDAVKATCAIDTSDNVYVPAYDRKLYKLDPKQRECVWSCPIRSGSPARAVVLKECVFVTTIKGSLEAINMDRGMLLWLYQTQAPIFSSLAIFCESGFISSVDGVVTKIRLNDGKKEVAANTHEPIFARVSIFCNLVHIVTQSGSLFLADLMLHILRSFRFASCSFVVPPRTVRDNAVGLVSSSGLFIIFNKDNGEAHAFRLGAGQVFSSVVVSYETNCMIAGCRDDWLRCFKLPVGFL
ncbi:PQQ enzyme repeat protein [Necator americanus]|uniref:PQQ enzyme repeat protein n=1 Tax=Necator americanus TaxID=51031 RepID=W2TSX5_NECAM|nr:PQQ enzyme repeat protein [Necator americanus]ETN84858.1 PQQ enzyme repeat protein [Necator americanus]